MTEPRTEAGRRLLGLWEIGGLETTALMADAILAIEAEAAAGPRDEGLREARDYDEREAIELCPECGGQYSDLAGHRRFAHNAALAKASE